jgi:ketosteroid isomerase-like protein
LRISNRFCRHQQTDKFANISPNRACHTHPPAENIAVVRRLYEARGNPEVIRQVLAPDVRWESRRLPQQQRLCRARSGARTFLQTTLRRLEDWHTEASEFYAANDRVFALDTYSARARATGRTFKARFAHVWTLRDAMIVRLQQCADTRNSRKRWAKISAKVPAPVKRGGEIAGGAE